MSKLSIIALLLMVTTKVQNRRRVALWAIGGLNIAVNAIQIIFIWVQCRPVSHTWDRASAGSCPYTDVANNYSYFQGVVSVSTDFFLAFYPMTVVWTLQLSKSTKWAFSILMAGGVL